MKRSLAALVLCTAGAVIAHAGVDVEQRASPGRVEVLESVDAVPAAIMGRFRDPTVCARVPGGPYYVFDRRGHSVHTIDAGDGSVRTLVEIGGEEGRLLDPSAFDVAADGSFAVADGPGGRERIQVFGAAGIRTGGFTRAGRTAARVALGSLVLSGVGSLVYTGRSVVLSEPDTGWLLGEFTPLGAPLRSIGRLRPTGHEEDREVHLALNAGMAVPTADGGFMFVFIAGSPAFRRYAADGTLLFERVIQGAELDPVLAAQPKRWPRRTVGDRQLPLVPPVVRTTALDPDGNLWVTFVQPFTYVYAPDGEKIRTVQFRAGGVVAPTSLSFSSGRHLVVAPGCYSFAW
ncbi:MAG: hypothetical protein IT178_16050 [Acidobacteria bacterium]|nr:hypothetical protein [Acidobacteriota bacterium]